MSRKFTISQFDKLYCDFLDIDSPQRLSDVLCVKVSDLIKHTRDQAYKSFPVKNGKKRRIIVEPNHELKQIQRRLNNYLQAVYYLNKPDGVHGFVKCPSNSKVKYSILSNASQHVKKPYVINADIFRFFPSITGNMVKNIFTKKPFYFDENLASAIALLCIKKNWLPTGAPTSPVIANLVCMELDKELEAFASNYNYCFTRYADDITFSGTSKPDANFKKELTLILKKYGFKLNFKKFRVLSKNTRQTVTGLVVNEKLSVNRKYKRKLRAINHDIEMNGVDFVAGRNATKPFFVEFESNRLKNSVKAKNLFVEKVGNYNTSRGHSESELNDGKSSKYLLFVDLELDGFIIDVFDNKLQASKKMEELWEFIESLRLYSHDEIVEKIRSISQNSYKLTEKNRYESVSLESRSNGFCTTGVVGIDNIFTIETYLKKRTKE